MSIFISALTIVDKIGRYSQRLRKSRKLNLTELRLKPKLSFQLATFRTARNLFAFSSRIETLDLCYKGAIIPINLLKGVR